ncbi:MAG: hypothetical protein ABL982_25040 [Vicinamibacterales bacterium]
MFASAPLQSTAGSAQEAGSNSSLAVRIADGRPWQMRMEDGRKTTLVLLANGTGTMTGGPMALSPTWRPIAGGMCLKPATLIPERCVILSPTSNGFTGTRDGTTVFTLER